MITTATNEAPRASWKYLGYGDCDNSSKIAKVGTARSLDDAKQKMLSESICNFDGAILMYSRYSYSRSWGFYCCRANARRGSNRNWSLYQLSK